MLLQQAENKQAQLDAEIKKVADAYAPDQKTRRQFRADAAQPFDDYKADQEALRRVVDYYAERLAANPAALAYLEKRGLSDPELLKTFRLGYCDRTLGLRLPQEISRVERRHHRDAPTGVPVAPHPAHRLQPGRTPANPDRDGPDRALSRHRRAALSRPGEII